MNKTLLLGNEAVARGLYEAGVKVVSAYPGTPSTEITEAVSKNNEIYSEWAPNEKVAFEVAFGAAMGGVRSFCAMKHVGLNVAADPLYTASYIGVNGGMVCAVADDPGMHSSQNEQDSRRHAIGAKVPMLEPSDSAECREFTKLAYEISEKYDTPVLLRLSTRISHSRSLVTLSERQNVEIKPYKKNIQKNVMMPAMAKQRHIAVEKRTEELVKYAENCEINRIEDNGAEIGIICAGSTYMYAHEALGNNADYLKLGIVNPLPVELIKKFACDKKKVYVCEELDNIIETHCKANGIDVIGREVFSPLGEYNQNIIADALGLKTQEYVAYPEVLPARPPVLCAGCPHRGFYYAIKKYNLYVSGDIGCYTLGAANPLCAIDSCVCMGASVSGLHGFNLARGEENKSLAVIGDSTFAHSGITGLINIVYNKGISTVVVLDNSITGMTGHQNNPCNGFTIKNEPTVSVNLEALAHSIGINRVSVVDPLNVKQVREVVERELNVKEPSLIISRRPCALLKSVKHKKALAVDEKQCIGCRSCLNVGCPAISVKGKDNNGIGKAVIDGNQCLGCGVCTYACPKNAIIGECEA